MAEIATPVGSGLWPTKVGPRHIETRGNFQITDSHSHGDKSTLDKSLDLYLPVDRLAHEPNSSGISTQCRTSRVYSPAIQCNSSRSLSRLSEPPTSIEGNVERGTGSKAADIGNHRLLCPYCGDTFSVSKSLKRHLNTIHRGLSTVKRITEHQCDICHQTFKRRDILTRHHDYQHKRQRVQCTLCGKSVTERALQGHLRSRACEAMRALEDARQVSIFGFSAAMFTSESLLDPLLAASQLLCVYTTVYNQDDTSRLRCCVPLSWPELRTKTHQALEPAYRRLRDLTLRTILRTLCDEKETASSAFAGALLTMGVLDWALGFYECSILYCNILRSNWTATRYQSGSGEIHATMQSAFLAPNTPVEDISAFNRNAKIPLNRVDHFADALINRPRRVDLSMRMIRASIAASR